jgi:membrane fusion protein, multidrug efflux system
VLSMKKRIWLLGLLAVLVVAGIAVAKRDSWNGAVAQAPRPAARGVPVEVVVAAKKTSPVQVEVLGSVTPIASVAVKSRVDSEIVGVPSKRRQGRSKGCLRAQLQTWNRRNAT